MTPPEVVLDRWLKTQARDRPGCRGYIGKLDLDKIEPPSFGSFLQFVQKAMNQALQLESAKASGGAEHPPFHFDYVDVNDGTRNAHAFQHGGLSFIAITLPLVRTLWDISQLLSQSPLVLGLLEIERGAIRIEALQALFFQLELAFLVSHEYTHHVHGHSAGSDSMWDEFVLDASSGSLKRQAQELDADGYGLYLTLGNYLRGAARLNALRQVGKESLSGLEGDEFLLITCFVAIEALFCSMWPDRVPIASIAQLTHPPAPVRIEYAIRVATMWCDQNASVSRSWFEAERFRAIYVAATIAIGGGRAEWDEHFAFLQSNGGSRYDQHLFEQFEAVRKAGEHVVRTRSEVLTSGAAV